MRLASLAPGATEVLYALGCGEDIVCVTEHCDYPYEAREKVNVWGAAGLNYDRLARLKPDVVLTESPAQERMAAELHQRGFRVEHQDPRTLDQVFAGILAIGKLVGKAKAAREGVAGMKKRITAIRAAAADKPRPRVYCEEWHMPPTAAQNWVPELVDAAGGVPYGKNGVPSAPVNMEDLTRFDPEIIILHWTGFGARSQTWDALKRHDWAHLSALRKKRIYIVHDALLNRPGPRLVDGCGALATLFHPESLKDGQEQDSR